jgi:hypothetical protein
MITFKHTGNFSNTEKFFAKAKKVNFRSILESYAKEGVNALIHMTPVDSGETASLWGYKITIERNGFNITWTNDNIVNGVPIAIILQYGHGTGTGGYVQGRDYINPAIKPVFDQISERLWKEVSSL